MQFVSQCDRHTNFDQQLLLIEAYKLFMCKPWLLMLATLEDSIDIRLCLKSKVIFAHSYSQKSTASTVIVVQFPTW